MQRFEVLVRISNPNPAAQALGLARYDIIVAAPVGFQWSEAELRGPSFRVRTVPVLDDLDALVAARIQARIDAGKHPCVAYPYRDTVRGVNSAVRLVLNTSADSRTALDYARRMAGT